MAQAYLIRGKLGIRLKSTAFWQRAKFLPCGNTSLNYVRDFGIQQPATVIESNKLNMLQ